MSVGGRPRMRTRSSTALLATLPWMAPPQTYTYSNRLYKAGELLDPLLTATYDEPDKIQAFGEALQRDTNADDTDVDGAIATALLDEAAKYAAEGKSDAAANSTYWELEGEPLSTPRRRITPPISTSPGSAHTSSTKRIVGFNPPSKKHNKDMFLSAASDFAPIRQRLPAHQSSHHHQVRLQGTDTGRRAGQLYALLRWPLLALVFGWIAVLFYAYVLTRQVVNLGEYLVTWRGPKRKLRNKLRQAKNWGEWISAAREMDQLLGLAAWREKEPSGLYDWVLVKKVTRSLRIFRERREADNLLGVLDLCLRSNFAGVEGFRLYSETYFGTKRLIEDYVDQVERSLSFVQHAGPDLISLDAKRSFHRAVRRRLGSTALCLSGGASFAYYHFGVARALLDAALLPKIVTGTSAGGLVAALICTRHDHELDRLLVPELADHITACEESIFTWGPRLWKQGSRFDARQFAEKAQFFTLGSLTFMEAYQRTGKMLNISVIPADRNSPVKLLNYNTAPDCVIWSALLASAAVPGVLQPICLMQKTKSGTVSPMSWGTRFKDGSLRCDIPQLKENDYPIVSQANPHVHLFFFAPRGMPGRPVAHRKGRGWRGGFLLAALEHFLKLQLSLSFQFLKDLDLLPEVLGQDWSSAFLQSFGGTVTIWPKTRFWDWPRILTDPDRAELHRMLSVGQSVTFPKLHMIENRMRIERAVENVRRTVHAERKREHRISSEHNHAVEAGIERAVVSGIGRALALYQTHDPLTDTDGEADSADRVRGSKHQQQQPSSRSSRTPLVTVNGLPASMVRTQSAQSSSPLANSMHPGPQAADSAGTSPVSTTKTRSIRATDGFSTSVGTSTTGDEQYVSAPDADSGDESDATDREDDAPLTASLLAQPHHGGRPPSRSHSLLDLADNSAHSTSSPNHSPFASRGTISQDLSLPIPPWHADASGDSGSDDDSTVY